MGRASQEGLLSSPTVVATPAAVLCPPHMGLASLWASGCPPPFLIASSTAEALPSPVCPPPLGRQPQGGHWEGRGLGRSRDLWDSCTPLLGMSSTNTAHAFQRKALLSCGLHLDNVSPAPRRVLLALLPGPLLEWESPRVRQFLRMALVHCVPTARWHVASDGLCHLPSLLCRPKDTIKGPLALVPCPLVTGLVRGGSEVGPG